MPKKKRRKKKLVLLVSEDLWEKLSVLAEKMDVTVNKVAVIILSVYLDRYAEAIGVKFEEKEREEEKMER